MAARTVTTLTRPSGPTRPTSGTTASTPTAWATTTSITRIVDGRTILSDITLTLVAGEVAAVIGPSGSGKSTLLDVLGGGCTPERGTVSLDGEALASRLLASPGVVGIVPQDDVVPAELTVGESLEFAARLRLTDRSPAQREAAVNRVLRVLGLLGVRGNRIGDPDARGISGGQRKRVNLAPELLSDEAVVLLMDEPTSGLDPGSAGDVARTARQLADAGRVVVLVTHDLSETVLAQVDHLIVLAPGGHLAWSGSVTRALLHFGVSSPAEIFACLHDETAEGWSSRLRASAAAKRWALRIQGARAATSRALTPSLPLGPTLATLLHRVALTRIRDRSSLAVLALQPALVAIVMLIVFPRPTAGLIFLLTLSCFWLGMSAAVRELIADRIIWQREARIGVTASAWVASKAGILAVLVGLQCSLCVAAAVATGLPGGGFSIAGLTAASVLTGWCGAATGLWVSTWWRRTDAAVGTIVLLVMPQIALSGVLTPLSQLGTWGQAFASVTPLRYAFHLALVQGNELNYLKLGAWHARPVSGELFFLGLRPGGEGSLGLPAPALVAILAAFTLVQLLLAMRGMRRRL